MERVGSVTAVVGLQRGDEGKGRFVDMLAEEHEIVARFNGGPNAGHTVVLPSGDDFKLNLIPSGITHKGNINVIGNGCLVDPIKLMGEIEGLREKGVDVTPRNLKISSAAHLILPHHKIADHNNEQDQNKAQGTTKSGIWPAAADKYARVGARAESTIEDKQWLSGKIHNGLIGVLGSQDNLSERVALKNEFMHAAAKLGEFVVDTTVYLNDELRKGNRILAEGAQAFLLDIDHGMYPDVTSSTTISGGISSGLGIAPRHIGQTIGVMKAVQSHVGDGPFVTEIHDEDLLDRLHGDKSALDAECGTTTGRTRRLGYLDLAGIRRALLINAPDDIYLTKFDWVPRYGNDLKVCTGYERKGEVTKIAPDSSQMLKQSSPVYALLENWSDKGLQDVREFEELPESAQDYLKFIGKALGSNISKVGVGPRRDQVINI